MIPEENIEQTETVPTDNPPVDEQKPTEPEVEPTGPSAEDYKKGMFKAQAKVKELEALLETPSAPREKVELSDEDQDGLKILGELFDQRLKPVMSKLEQNEKVTAVQEIMSQPYSQALEPEITAEFKELPDTIPFADRMRQARSNAIANNLPKIIEVNRELGKQEAYANKDNKSQIKGVNTPARVTEPNKGWQDKLEAGERLTSQEYRDNRTAILDWETKQSETR